MSDILTLPGLIDPHVHLRDPGQTHKEDFFTGTSAALAGGYTTIMDMPNNATPITTLQTLEEKIESASKQIVCDVGFHFGTLGDNFDEFAKVIDKVCGLKIYMNVTTGNFIVDKDKLIDIYKAWPSDKPILLHAEGDVLYLVEDAVRQTKKTTYVCHVSSETELSFVVRTKDEGLPVYCGVTPHHLLLSGEDEKKHGAYCCMKPSLKTETDMEYLWDHMDYIDVIESDHAPHTREEKDSDPPPFGVPGLETTLPLMLTEQKNGRLSQQDVEDKLYNNPQKIFNVAKSDDTSVEIAKGKFEIRNEELKTKCGWSPFAGREVAGKVEKVTLRGEVVYDKGEVLAKPGSGRIIS